MPSTRPMRREARACRRFRATLRHVSPSATRQRRVVRRAARRDAKRDASGDVRLTHLVGRRAVAAVPRAARRAARPATSDSRRRSATSASRCDEDCVGAVGAARSDGAPPRTFGACCTRRCTRRWATSSTRRASGAAPTASVPCCRRRLRSTPRRTRRRVPRPRGCGALRLEALVRVDALGAAIFAALVAHSRRRPLRLFSDSAKALRCVAAARSDGAPRGPAAGAAGPRARARVRGAPRNPRRGDDPRQGRRPRRRLRQPRRRRARGDRRGAPGRRPRRARGLRCAGAGRARPATLALQLRYLPRHAQLVETAGASHGVCRGSCPGGIA